MWTFACTLAIVLLDMDKYKNLFPTEELISYFYMYFNIIIDTLNILQVSKCGQPRPILHAR